MNRGSRSRGTATNRRKRGRPRKNPLPIAQSNEVEVCEPLRSSPVPGSIKRKQPDTAPYTGAGDSMVATVPEPFDSQNSPQLNQKTQKRKRKSVKVDGNTICPSNLNSSSDNNNKNEQQNDNINTHVESEYESENKTSVVNTPSPIRHCKKSLIVAQVETLSEQYIHVHEDLSIDFSSNVMKREKSEAPAENDDRDENKENENGTDTEIIWLLKSEPLSSCSKNIFTSSNIQLPLQESNQKPGLAMEDCTDKNHDSSFSENFGLLDPGLDKESVVVVAAPAEPEPLSPLNSTTSCNISNIFDTSLNVEDLMETCMQLASSWPLNLSGNYPKDTDPTDSSVNQTISSTNDMVQRLPNANVSDSVIPKQQFTTATDSSFNQKANCQSKTIFKNTQEFFQNLRGNEMSITFFECPCCYRVFLKKTDATVHIHQLCRVLYPNPNAAATAEVHIYD